VEEKCGIFIILQVRKGAWHTLMGNVEEIYQLIGL